MSIEANIQELIRSGKIKTVQDIDAMIKEIYKHTLEGMLEAEIEDELGYSRYDYRNKQTANSRNGKRKKTVRSRSGDLELEVPRDRNGEFEPQSVPKRTRDISSIEDKILGLYARGMSTRDIVDQLEEIYGTKLSPTLVSQLSDKILPLIESWNSRELAPCYPLLWLDGFHMKIRTDGRSKTRCAHVIMGINLDGYKEVVGIWFGDAESSKFWLEVLTDLKNRGVEEILMCTVDGLSGFKEAIASVYPETQVQRCIVHQVRYSTRFAQTKDRKAMAADMKAIYTAPNENVGRVALEAFAQNWEEKYRYAVKSWYENWEELSQLYQYTPEIRRLMYTTNPIESLNREFRKAVKTKSSFPHEQAAMKLMYLVVRKREEKWERSRVKNWGLIISQLMIHFDERITKFMS